MNIFYQNHLIVYGNMHDLMKFEALMSSYDYRILHSKFAYQELIDAKDEGNISVCNIYFSKSFNNKKKREEHYKLIYNPGMVHDIEFKNTGSISYDFSTKYAPCYGTYILLSKKFPKLWFTLIFKNSFTGHEESCEFSGGAQGNLMVDSDAEEPYGYEYEDKERKIRNKNNIIHIDNFIFQRDNGCHSQINA